MNHPPEPRATFSRMDQARAEEWTLIGAAARRSLAELPAQLIDNLRKLAGDHAGFAVDRLTHSLQTATRALRDARDEEYVACALLHDIGDLLGPANHAEIAAAIVKPFVRAELHWMVEHHGIFQGYYFFEHMGLDKHMRERLRGHPAFELTAQFCAQYDQVSFDAHYPAAELEDFRPLLARVFARPRQSIYGDTL